MNKISKVHDEGLSRREREKLRHKSEVLVAAEELFAEKGFHAVSMQEIAAHSEYAVGTLYQLFENKEAMYAALLEHRADIFMERVGEILETEESPLNRIRMLVEAYVEYFLKERSFFKIYIQEMRVFTWNVRASMNDSLQKKYDGYIEMVRRVFREAIAKKQICRLDPEDLALAFLGITHSFLSHWITTEQDIDVEEGARRIKEIFLDPLRLKKPVEIHNEGKRR